MKQTFLVLAVLILSFVSFGCINAPENLDVLGKIKKNDYITIGVRSDSKPFGYIDKDSELKGFDIELAKLITKGLLGDENKVKFVYVTPSNRIISLTSGKVDMVIATMTITPQRKSVVNFSDPYYIAGQAVMVLENSNIKSASDLNDKKVIVILGSTGEKNIRYFAPNAIIQGYKTNTEAYQALKNGLADALTTDDTILTGFSMDDNTVRILPKRYTQEPYAIAFRQEKNSDNLKKSVNLILDNLKNSGQLNKLRHKWTT